MSRIHCTFGLAVVPALLDRAPAGLRWRRARTPIQDNTPYGTTSAEFLLFGAGARGTALGGCLRRDRHRRQRAVLQPRRRRR